MEFVALCPPYDLCNPYRSMEAIGPQRNSPSLAQGVLQSLLPSALDKGILFKGDVYTAEPDPTLHERTSSKSEATGPASPPFREESCDEAVYRYLVQEYISPDTLDSDEGFCVHPTCSEFTSSYTFLNLAITHPPYSRGYDDGPCCGESDHHRSREGSPLRSTQHNGADDARMAPIQDFGCPLSASGNNTLGAGGPQFQTVYPPATQQPSDPSDILKLLERHGIGRATCLWMHDGIRCGYSSQIDLVKRHIKRVHFRLR